MFVSNLPTEITEKQLEEVFETVAPVMDLHFSTDKDTGASLGFAYVEFGSEENAEKAAQEMDGSVLNGQTIRVALQESGNELGLMSNSEVLIVLSICSVAWCMIK